LLNYIYPNFLLVPDMNISLKAKIQHWFNFLRLANQSKDTAIIESLKQHSEMYEPWSNYRNTSFTKWWKEHSDLFRSVSVIREMNATDIPDNSALFLAIPFTYAPTTVAKMVQEIYKRQQDQRRVSKGKVKKVYGGEFALTSDDFQASQFHYYYRFAKDVYLPLNSNGGQPRTKDYVSLAEKVFAKQRLVTSWEEKSLARRRVPFTDRSAPYANKSRMARNYVMVVQNLLRNVCTGEFPGDYLTVAVKNQSQKRKKLPVYSASVGKRGVSQKRYVNLKKRESPFDMYSKRKPN
jgi:hypothetical protein